MRKDAASADLSVEARHRAAQAMLRRYPPGPSIAQVIAEALLKVPHLCCDDCEDRQRLAAHLVAELSQSTDARFLRELLGEDPADRMTRMHAHGALLDRAVQAAWRLALGGE